MSTQFYMHMGMFLFFFRRSLVMFSKFWTWSYNFYGPMPFFFNTTVDIQ